MQVHSTMRHTRTKGRLARLAPGGRQALWKGQQARTHATVSGAATLMDSGALCGGQPVPGELTACGTCKHCMHTVHEVPSLGSSDSLFTYLGVKVSTSPDPHKCLVNALTDVRCDALVQCAVLVSEAPRVKCVEAHSPTTVPGYGPLGHSVSPAQGLERAGSGRLRLCRTEWTREFFRATSHRSSSCHSAYRVRGGVHTGV